jgi:hypothetical protein
VAVAACILGLVSAGLLVSTILIASERSNTLAAFKIESQQREAAVKQRMEADQQRQAADESFRQARQAVDTFLALSEEELAGKPGLLQVRRKFLNSALDYYNDFLEQRRDDPAVAEALGESASYVESIMEELAKLDRLASLVLLQNEHVLDDLNATSEQREALKKPLSEIGFEADENPFGMARALLEAQGTITAQLPEVLSQIDSILTGRQIAR